MNEKHHGRKVPGGQGDKHQQHGQSGQRPGMQKPTKGPEQWGAWKEQSEPAQQGGERRSGGRTNQR